ncbi:T9SS type A sorting domain-containing protein [Flavobacterium sp. GT3R68]|uniref:T9SS type A sorting domain-containing protein n=1 Tax=Flavobacterium sp. GT3R68 TaxID=2594437 RepID=UPI000F864BCB|nr:T9SS type A sorting domain-containing protein [Flavobacterium sp. GT3R68]RTY93415.1 T9SS type A sorting domain-containing protein [Flavobacterium sp. GSN2]
MKTIVFFTLTFLFFSTSLLSQVGCTDPLASNYSSVAVTNNGSCIYPDATVSPQSSINLSPVIDETSGLIEWNNNLLTHNDDTDTNIYELNKTDGSIIQNYPLNSIQNIDWEEIAQDADYIYIGDFGNNSSGNRTNLKIYRIAKNSISTSPQIDAINFSYSNQLDFSAQAANNTDFDCEAFVVTSSGILLFTKQWISNNTSVYLLPKTPGTYIAVLSETINVSGLITGATSKENLNLIALSGYTSSLQPFVFLLYDYIGVDFSTSNKRKINISLPYHQVEGISTTDGLEYYITNESFVNAPFVNNPQKLHQFSLDPYLADYINSLSNESFDNNKKIIVVPNPVGDELFLEYTDSRNQEYQIFDTLGKLITKGITNKNQINVQSLEKGVYFLKLNPSQKVYKILKK